MKEKIFWVQLTDLIMTTGISKVAQETGLPRQTIYSMLQHRNPKLATLLTVVKACGVGLKLNFEEIKND